MKIAIEGKDGKEQPINVYGALGGERDGGFLLWCGLRKLGRVLGKDAAFLTRVSEGGGYDLAGFVKQGEGIREINNSRGAGNFSTMSIYFSFGESPSSTTPPLSLQNY